MTLDRTQPPEPKPIEYEALPAIDRDQLPNQLPVYLIPYQAFPVTELQFVFYAGSAYEPKAGVAQEMGRMITEGTERRDSPALAEALDYYGANISTDTGYEITTITLSVLSRNLLPALELLAEVIFEPAFPAHEFDLLKQRQLQNLAIEEERTSYHAKRQFGQLLFGGAHPYGRHIGRPEMEQVQLGDIRAFHRSHIHPGNGFMILAGQYDHQPTRRKLEELFGHPQTAGEPQASLAQAAPDAPTTGRHLVSLPGHSQATLRIGHRGFARSHPDYHLTRFGVILLGGYFGSRLMRNIREEKGYTYGIGANWVSLRYGGYLIIGSEVGNEYVTSTLAEVHKELAALCEAPPSDDELDVARNYFLGQILSNHETAFQIADLVKTLLVNDVPLDDEERGFQAIQQTTPSELHSVYSKHLQPDQLLEVVSGPESL